MLKSVWQIIILVSIISFVVLMQNSFIGALDHPFRHFNLLLSVLIFILFFFDLRLALLSAFVAGVFMDLISFNFFGFYLLLLFLSVLVVWYILKNWLTNRSFYTLLALLFLVIVFYNLAAIIALYLAGASYSFMFLIRPAFWSTIFYQIIWSGLFALITFNLSASLSKRIKPFFLENKSLYDDF
jgi:cell shape-determining protein MreD